MYSERQYSVSSLNTTVAEFFMEIILKEQKLGFQRKGTNKNLVCTSIKDRILEHNIFIWDTYTKKQKISECKNLNFCKNSMNYKPDFQTIVTSRHNVTYLINIILQLQIVEKMQNWRKIGIWKISGLKIPNVSQFIHYRKKSKEHVKIWVLTILTNKTLKYYINYKERKVWEAANNELVAALQWSITNLVLILRIVMMTVSDRLGYQSLKKLCIYKTGLRTTSLVDN